MSSYLPINNFSTTLTSVLSSTDFGAFVDPADAAVIDSALSGTYDTNQTVLLTFNDGSNIENIEISGANSITGELFIVSRAKEGTTTPASFPVGTSVQSCFTAGMAHQIISYYSTGLNAGTNTFNHGSANYRFECDVAATIRLDHDNNRFNRNEIIVSGNGSGTVNISLPNVAETVLEDGLSMPVSVNAGSYLHFTVVQVGYTAFISMRKKT